MHITIATNLVVQVAMMLLVALRRAICRTEPTKSRRVHLLLKEVTIVRIVNVRVILQSLHQVLWIVPLSTARLTSLASTSIQNV